MAEKISQLPAAAALTGAEQVPAVQGGATVQLPIGAIHTPDYISGLKMVWNSANSLSVTSGAAYISSLGRVVRLGAPANLAGLVLTASTWYHLYLYLNAGAPAVECVSTAPAAPYYGTAQNKTGDTSRRYIGSVMTDASGNILQFVHIGTSVYYPNGFSTAAPYRALSVGTATASTAVSLSGIIPATATAVLVRIALTNTNSGSSANIQQAVGSLVFTNANNSSLFNGAIPVTSQAIAYFFIGGSPTGGGMYVDVNGYTYER